MDSSALQGLANLLREKVEIKNRTYHLQTFKNCFVGKDAVDALIKEGVIETREAAVEVGLALQEEGLLSHVTKDEKFQDGQFFYRFDVDEEFRGKNKDEAWTANWSLEKHPSINNGPKTAEEGEREMDLEVSPLDEHNAMLLNNVKPKSWENPKEKTFSLLVIGAGAGGLISAIQGAGIGIKTALIEKHLMGGDCLNVGCVPSKALLKCAKIARDVRTAAEFGVEVNGEVNVNFGKIMERMRKLRAEISPADSSERYTKLGVNVFQGTAKFLSKNSVVVTGTNGEEMKLKFSKCIIASGGRAFVPPVEGLKDVKYLTNASLFNLTELPKTFGIIGSGPIGTEMAQAFANFGSKVFVFDMQDKILPREDQDAAKVVQHSMEQDGVTFMLKSELRKISQTDDGRICVEFRHQNEEKRMELDQLLVSAGRTPNIEGLDLEKAGVEYHRKGIKVQDGLQTTNSNIYAVGDVCLKYQFTHMADASAKVAFRNAMFPFTNEKMSKQIIPWCTYTFPEIAHVGLTLADLNESGVKFDTFKMELADNDRARLEGGVGADGFVKMYIKKGSDQIVGCTIVADNAGEMISEVTVAMNGKIGAKALSTVIHPYPTQSDAIRLTAGQFNKTRLTAGTKRLLKNLSSIKTALA